MRRKTTHTAPTGGKKPRRRLDKGRKLDILGILMLVVAVLLALAVVSYSPRDESATDLGFRDLLRLFGGDPDIRARADMTRNWLGLTGALTAGFLIRTTIGYFSLAFPILLGFWGWFIFRRRDLGSLAYYTNYAIIFVFLLAAFFGVLRLVPWMPDIGPNWSGNIGDFLAGLAARLLGTTGSVVMILTTVVILAIVVVDYDIHRTVERFRSVIAALVRPFHKTVAETTPSPDARFKTPVSLPPLDTPAVPRVSRPGPDLFQKTGVQAERVELPPQHPVVPVSITRPGLSPRTAEERPVVPTSGAELRSDGIIPFEHVEELRGIYEETAQTPEEAEGKTVYSREGKNGASVSRTQAEAGEKGGEISGGTVLSDQEKRAVQRAAARAQVPPDMPDDSEESNAEIARDRLAGYEPPHHALLDEHTLRRNVSDTELNMKAGQLVEKLSVFGVAIRDIKVIPGPVVTQFELVPDSGVKISRIVSLADDLALALAARGIRIIAPIPGKGAVGVEIPNNEPEIVGFRSVVTSPQFQRARFHLPLGLGASITGDIFCDDLAKMPHLLMAGATGSGKSVGINVMINSLLFKLHPSDVKFVMIDPKKIELQQYKGLRNHFLAVSPDIDEDIVTDPDNAVVVLKSLELEMDMRYTKLAKAGVRHVNDYNAKVAAGHIRDADGIRHYKLPYIVVVIDELADLMITAAREVEEPIARLAQLARAVGIHLIVATQRPSVDVITGVIKANFSARIAYQVASRIDSRTILDTPGADQLLGNGDMLYQPSGRPKPVRIQNAFLGTAEVERVVRHIAEQRGCLRPYSLPSVKSSRKNASRSDAADTDELLYEAAKLIVRYRQGSVSLLQRRLKIGYSRAARIVDQLEAAGIVGPADGSKAREVLVEDESRLEELLFP
ncbi:MAG: DNA translocase FtsK [Bacteroidota bacterium]|nr:DNA translocase FtsK [Bacteroidota bacterium]